MQAKAKAKKGPALFLLLIDGPMGAGKTTVAKLLHKKLKRTAHIGLDRIKWFISDFERSYEDNAIVRAVVLAMTKEYLKQGISVMMEQGMKKEWVGEMRRIARQKKAAFLFYRLEAPKPLLLRRIKQRPGVPGKPKVSAARIARNYRIYLANKHPAAIVIDSEKLSARQIASRILKDIQAL